MGGQNRNNMDCKSLSARYGTFGDVRLASTWYSAVDITVGDFFTTYASTNSTIGLSLVYPTSNIPGVGNVIWQMTTSATAALYFSFFLPMDYKEGTNITPYVTWTVSGSTASSAYTTLGLAYTFGNQNSTASSNATMATVLQLATTGSTAFASKTTNFAAITGTSKDIGAIFTGGLYIDTTVANSTYAGSIYIQGMRFVYQTDSFGSTYGNGYDK